MTSTSWRQSNVTFADWSEAEPAALAHLLPMLTAAEHEEHIVAWFFVRKAPCWRIRYLPTDDAGHRRMRCRLQDLTDPDRTTQITQVTSVVYEPEIHAFGGRDAMQVAHRLFHRDSRHLLNYLAGVHLHPGVDRRRELAILLCTALLRSARLDWYEQGDVWAQMAQHRGIVNRPPADAASTFTAGVRRLMSVDPTNPMRPGGPLEFAADWGDAYSIAGAELADLAAAGLLHRGLRAVLAHHLIFSFNRFGLPYATQAALADAATSVVFGVDPTTTSSPRGEPSWRTQVLP